MTMEKTRDRAQSSHCFRQENLLRAGKLMIKVYTMKLLQQRCIIIPTRAAGVGPGRTLPREGRSGCARVPRPAVLSQVQGGGHRPATFQHPACSVAFSPPRGVDFSPKTKGGIFLSQCEVPALCSLQPACLLVSNLDSQSTLGAVASVELFQWGRRARTPTF